MSRVEIYSPTYNGMYILPMFIDHYQERFPGCRINILDDGSTDETREYCESRGCIIKDVSYRANKHWYGHEPIGMMQLRNKCWKDSEAEWIIVVDQDELVDVWEKDLEFLKDFDVLILKGYDMFALGETDPKKFSYGRLHPWYCKPVMFRKSIGEINFALGSHSAKPPGDIRWCRYHFNLYHYARRHLSKEHFIEYLSKSVSSRVASKLYDEETNLSRLKKIRNN
jgi:glycosyltransferase involved in cell wall biosynthesis